MSRDVISSGKFQADRFWCPRDYQISSLNSEWLWQAVGWVIDVLAAITQIDFYRSCLALSLSLSLFCSSSCFIYLFIFWSGVVSWCRLSADIRVFCVFSVPLYLLFLYFLYIKCLWFKYHSKCFIMLSKCSFFSSMFNQLFCLAWRTMEKAHTKSQTHNKLIRIS